MNSNSEPASWNRGPLSPAAGITSVITDSDPLSVPAARSAATSSLRVASSRS
jgi:hypothetical protein